LPALALDGVLLAGRPGLAGDRGVGVHLVGAAGALDGHAGDIGDGDVDRLRVGQVAVGRADRDLDNNY